MLPDKHTGLTFTGDQYQSARDSTHLAAHYAAIVCRERDMPTSTIQIAEAVAIGTVAASSALGRSRP